MEQSYKPLVTPQKHKNILFKAMQQNFIWLLIKGHIMGERPNPSYYLPV